MGGSHDNRKGSESGAQVGDVLGRQGDVVVSLILPASVSFSLFFALLVCFLRSVQIAGPPKVYVSFVHLSSLHSCDFPSVLKSVTGHGTCDHHMWPLHPSDICLLKAVKFSKANFVASKPRACVSVYSKSPQQQRIVSSPINSSIYHFQKDTIPSSAQAAVKKQDLVVNSLLTQQERHAVCATETMFVNQHLHHRPTMPVCRLLDDYHQNCIDMYSVALDLSQHRLHRQPDVGLPPSSLVTTTAGEQNILSAWKQTRAVCEHEPYYRKACRCLAENGEVSA
jgi:hypothetical protein